MKRKKNYVDKAVLALVLVASLCLTPLQSAVAYAAEAEDASKEQVSQEAEVTETQVTEEAGKVPEADLEAENEIAELHEAEGAVEEEKADEDAKVEAQEEKTDAAPEETLETKEAVPDTEPTLVYGDENLKDEDAFILLMFGDGFTESEQDKFYAESEKIADYVMATSPWDEFKDVIKIYAKGVISNESGARADNAKNQEEADADTRDTYFGTSFWSGGMQRLVSVGSEGRQKVKDLTAQFLPAADFEVIIVNSETYGGSGGAICLASLNTESLEMMLHELGHTVADLADEYFAGASYAREYANMTAESDPEKVKWSRFIGRNGIGVYEYDNGGDGWYRPHENCKMRFLGKQYAFCEVCKEELRRAFCKGSTATKMFFQTYADIFYETETGKDMSEYFILRSGENETNGAELGDAFHLTYKDADGNAVEGIPYKAGTYTAEATFDGNDTYEACSLSAEYTIELPDLITLNVESKTYDGEPAKLGIDVNYDKEYDLKYHYTGTVPYAAEITYEYDSEEAPIKPGRYTVLVEAYDKESGEKISQKSKDYAITFKYTHITNNNTADYPGAMSYYNNKSIVFTGEGFTADEQDKFEEIAAEYVKYFRSMEPYKELDIYFNYSTVEAVSDESGIGKEAKNTYFKLTYDDNGKIVLEEDGGDAVQGAMYIGNNVITSYYRATIVIVNDENVKDGATFTNKRFTIFSTPDENGMEYAANELLNYFAGDAEGYRAVSEEEKAAQRTQLLKAVYYTWYGTDYGVLTSDAYKNIICETGKEVDLSAYFHTYILGKETEGIDYNITYYADNNGEVGEKLDAAPVEAGNYHAFAETDLKGASWSMPVELDGTTYNIPKARVWTAFRIWSAEELAEAVKQAEVDLKKAEAALKEAQEALEEAKKESEAEKAKAEAALKEAEAAKKEAEAAKKEAEAAKAKAASTQFKAKKASLKSVKSRKKKTAKVTWKKVSGAEGYQIQYSKKSNFKSAKKVTVKGASKKTKTLKKLTAKKKYYVRVRAYKTVNGKKVYTSWSAKKSVKIKK